MIERKRLCISVDKWHWSPKVGLLPGLLYVYQQIHFQMKKEKLLNLGRYPILLTILNRYLSRHTGTITNNDFFPCHCLKPVRTFLQDIILSIDPCTGPVPVQCEYPISILISILTLIPIPIPTSIPIHSLGREKYGNRKGIAFKIWVGVEIAQIKKS